MKKLLAAVFALLATAVFGQQADDAGDVVASPYAQITWGSLGTPNVTLTCYALQATQGTSACTVSVTGRTAPQTPQLNTRMVPGVKYDVILTANNGYNPQQVPGGSNTGTQSATLHIPAPTGYGVEINGQLCEQLTLAFNNNVQTSSVTFHVRVRALGTPELRAGMATALTTQRKIWQLSLGSLSNGGNAGTLSFDEPAADNGLASVFTRSAISVDPNGAEVTVVPDPADGTTVRQVIAPQVCVDITGTLTSGNIELKCYSPSQQSTQNADGTFTFTGDPFAWYHVQPNVPDANSATISVDMRNLADATTTGQTVVRTLNTTLNRTGTSPAFTWTATAWHTGTTSLVTTVRSRAAGSQTETVKVQDSNNAVGASTTRTYTTELMGEEITNIAEGSSNSATTSIDYWGSDGSNTGSAAYGRTKTAITNGSGWQGFEYDSTTGRPVKIHGPFINSDASLFPNDTGSITSLTYLPDGVGGYRMATQVSTIGGTVVGNASIGYADTTPFSPTYDGSHPHLVVTVGTRTDYTDSTHTLTSTTKFFNEGVGNPLAWAQPQQGQAAVPLTDDFFRGQPYSTIASDGTQKSFVYQRGSWNGSSFAASANSGLDYGTASLVAVISGSQAADPVAGGTQVTSYNGFPIDPIYLFTNKSTAQVTIRDHGSVVQTVLYAWTGQWTQLTTSTYKYNLAGELIERDDSNGGKYFANYSGEQKSDETDPTGVKMLYTYDAADRILTVQKANGPTTTYAYDSGSRVNQTTLSGPNTTETIVTSKQFDDAGRLSWEKVPGPTANAPLQTSYAYAYNANAYGGAAAGGVGGMTVTATLPSTAMKVSVTNADGSAEEISGSAVVPQYFTYGSPGTDGTRTNTVRIGSTTSSRLTSSTVDMLGRTRSTSRPAYNGGQFVEQAQFDDSVAPAANGTGRLLLTKKVDGAGTRLIADTLYQYNALSEVTRTGADLSDSFGTGSPNGTLDLGGIDRIADSDASFWSDGTNWWLVKKTTTYPTANSSSALLVSTSRQRLTGLGSGVFAESVSVDANGVKTDQTVTVTPSTTTVVTAVTVTDPSGATILTSNQTTTNGLVTSETKADGLAYNYGYDGLERRTSASDPRITTPSTIQYIANTGYVYTTKDGSGVITATYSYDSAGRVNVTTDAGGHATRVEYNARNQVIHQWGDATYPVEYAYDATYGDRLELHTFQTGDFTGVSWPGGTPTSITKWTYEAATGLITAKTDAANQSVTYTYNTRGQTATRTWARGVSTTYNYTPLTGELSSCTYSDATPSVSYTYTRVGQIAQVTDATGTRTFNYGQANASPYTNATQLDSITLPSYFGTRVLTRKYDSAGRGAGFVLGSAFNSSSDLSQLYTYNGQARFDHLVVSNSADTAARTYTYLYNTGGLVSNLGLSGTLGSAGAFGITYTYDPNRNLLTTIAAKVGTAVVSEHDYGYNGLRQRVTSMQSGSAFADIGTTTYNTNYNARGEVTSSADYIGGTGNIGNSTYQMSDRNFYYAYDDIGNRSASSRHGQPQGGPPPSNPADSYVVNNLNQYTSRTNLYAEAAGSVSSGTTSVAVSSGGQNWATPGRQGQYWAADWQPGTTPQAVPLSITATGTFNSTTYQRTDTSKTIYFPGNQTLQYDVDGNLTSDGVWIYGYDAENRVISMTSSGVTGFQNKFLDFTYDYLNRRVQKHSNNASTGAQTWRRYVYDGNNVVAELDVPSGTGTPTLYRSYAWGLDLTGSLTGAGGVGALLQITNHTGTITSYLPTYDGNGNVSSLVNASDGSVAVSYEYSPFGEVLRRGAPTYAGADNAILDNPFAFSTKFTDWETGLVYYGARFYSPSLGRFINRDPIAEQGGLNLYGFSHNDGINGYDYLGYKSFLSKFWNKYRHTIISAVLSVIPGVGPALAMAYNMAVGFAYGGLKGLAIGLVSSYIGGQIAGPISGGINAAAGVSGFAAKLVSGAVAGGFSGAVAAGIQGQNIGQGFLAGASSGALAAALTPAASAAFKMAAKGLDALSSPTNPSADASIQDVNAPPGYVHLGEPVVIGYDVPIVAKYFPSLIADRLSPAELAASDRVMASNRRIYDLQHPNGFRAVVRSFQEKSGVLITGARIGEAAPYVAVGAVGLAAAAPTLALVGGELADAGATAYGAASNAYYGAGAWMATTAGAKTAFWLTAGAIVANSELSEYVEETGISESLLEDTYEGTSEFRFKMAELAGQGIDKLKEEHEQQEAASTGEHE